MVHGVALRGGRAAWYRSRFVRDDEVVAAKGWPPVSGPQRADALGGGLANTNVISHAGKTLAIVEGGNLPVELSGDLETVAAQRLRRNASRRLQRAPEARSRHRRAARGGLRRRSRADPVRRRGRRRARAQDRRRARPGVSDGPRLRDHEELLRAARSARGARHGGGRAGRWAPLHVATRIRRARGPPAARGRRRGRDLARDRAVLRVPPAERVRGCATAAWWSTWFGIPQTVRERALPRERGSADARPLDDRPARRPREGGAPRRSAAGVPAPRRAARRQAASLRLCDRDRRRASASKRCSSTICARAGPSATRRGRRARSWSRCSFRAVRMPTRTTAGCSPTRTTRTRIAATS